MYPEDRVVVCVVKTKRDLKFVQEEGWYRIPQAQMPHGIYMEYIAFFLSGTVFKEKSGSVAYFARREGFELAYRRDLIPSQPDHKNADKVYYKIGLSDFRMKIPPITNPTRHSISFIHTTGDRFHKATEIKDLYSDADYFVDRIYHALRSSHIPLERFWKIDRSQTGYTSQLRILCQRGTVTASTERDDRSVYLDVSANEGAALAQIRAEIARHDGPMTAKLPMDYS